MKRNINRSKLVLYETSFSISIHRMLFPTTSYITLYTNGIEIGLKFVSPNHVQTLVLHKSCRVYRSPNIMFQHEFTYEAPVHISYINKGQPYFVT